MTERQAQDLQNRITQMRRNGEDTRKLELELNHMHSQLAAGGACDRAGN